MSYNNFVQTFWSSHIQTELEAQCVFTDFTNRQFEPEVIKGGAHLKIVGVDRPTIGTYVQGTDINIETVPDNSQFLDITEQDYFAFEVDDVDEAQSKSGLMEALTKEASIALAQETDKFMAGLVANGTKVTKTTAITTEALAKEAVDDAFVKLWKNNVPVTEETELIITPWFYNLFKNCLQGLETNNMKLIKDGIVGYYQNAKVKMSNNIYNTGTYDNMCLRTNKAMAYASQISDTEPFRLEKRFSDALKGLHVYGGKVVRPKEIICLQVKES
jgi:hypothetical protein